MKKFLIPLILALALTLIACGGSEQTNSEAITSLIPFDEGGLKIGVPTGAKPDVVCHERFPDCEIVQYALTSDGFVALKTAKIDGFCFTRNTLQYVVNQNPDLVLLPEAIADNDLVIGARLGEDAFMAEVNGVIALFHENGIRAEMEQRWLGTDLNPVMPDIPPPPAPVRTVVVGLDNAGMPMAYVETDGSATGFDAEYALRLGRELNWAIEFAPMEWPALIPALQSERIDLIISNMNVTEERQQSLLLSDVYLTTDLVMMVRAAEEVPLLNSNEDFIGKRIAFAEGENLEGLFEENIGDFIPVNCLYEYEAMEMVKIGRADAMMLDEPMARKWVLINPEMRIIYPPFAHYDFGVVFAADKESLRLSFNVFLREIKENGIYADMVERWIDTLESPPMPDIPLSADNGTIIFGSYGELEPFGYVVNGEPTGFDIELARRFAAYMDMGLDIHMMEWTALIPYVESGRADFAASLFTINEERAKSTNFSDPYYTGGGVLITKRPDAVGTFRPEDFAGKTFAIITGSIWDAVLEENIPEATAVYFNSSPETVMALRTGRVDATFTSSALSKRFVQIYPDLKVLMPPVVDAQTAFIFGKDKTSLRESFNAFLQEINDDGTHAEMTARWMENVESPPMPDIPTSGENGRLTFATTGAADVLSFIQDGSPAGFEVELAYRFAAYMGMELEIQLMDFAGLIPSVQTGKADFAGNNIAVTEERAQSVDFSDTVYLEGVVAVVRQDMVIESPGFIESLMTAIDRNLIQEDRWKLLVDGLVVSMVITIFGFILATILGFFVCGLRMSKNRILSAIGKLYVTILRGTPIVVLLMITFYVIFAKSSISGVSVAIIAFGINTAAFIGEILRSAILTIDKGQVEAARSMGFSKAGAFFTVTFPQAVRVAFPVYMSEFISLFKMTSVVGYIAVVDLTKAGDIIRSRTYDAFFPLIFVALVYLLVASVMIWIFGRIERMTNKRLRRDAET